MEGHLWDFRNLYAFLSQVIPYQDSDLEQLYTYLRFLASKLPKRSAGPPYHFDDEVRLEYYRLQKISEGSISLGDGYAKPLDGPREVGSGLVREEPVPLSRLINVVNEQFGTDFNEADQLFFDQIIEAAMRVDSLHQAAQANAIDRFQLVFRQVLESLFIERMDMNEDLFARFMNEAEFQEVVAEGLGQDVYERLLRILNSTRDGYDTEAQSQ
jgi:type I restriction enzyme R subunit